MKSYLEVRAGEELESRILRAIDKGLKEVLGEACTKSVYYYFQMRTGLQVKDIVKRPETFIDFLRDMFKAGAQVIEKRIREKLCAMFEVDLMSIEDADVVGLIRKLLAKKRL